MTDGTFHEIHRGDKVLAYERKGSRLTLRYQLNFSKKKN